MILELLEDAIDMMQNEGMGLTADNVELIKNKLTPIFEIGDVVRGTRYTNSEPYEIHYRYFSIDDEVIYYYNWELTKAYQGSELELIKAKVRYDNATEI